jgi:hypothetical protein
VGLAVVELIEGMFRLELVCCTSRGQVQFEVCGGLLLRMLMCLQESERCAVHYNNIYITRAECD